MFECAVCAFIVWGCMVCRFQLNVIVCFNCGLMGCVVWFVLMCVLCVCVGIAFDRCVCVFCL